LEEEIKDLKDSLKVTIEEKKPLGDKEPRAVIHN